MGNNMKMPAITPGPWSVDEDHSYHILAWPEGVAAVVASSDPDAPRPVMSDDEAIANAKAIAAVPQMIEALIEARLLIGLHGQKDDLHEAVRQGNRNKAWHLIDAALRLAGAMSNER